MLKRNTVIHPRMQFIRNKRAQHTAGFRCFERAQVLEGGGGGGTVGGSTDVIVPASRLVDPLVGRGENQLYPEALVVKARETDIFAEIEPNQKELIIEKDLSVLADGIYEGRRSFLNSMKYIFISIGATFGNMFSIAGASLFLPFLPMLPKQILLTNLITDLPFLTIASDHVDDEQLKHPGKWNLKLIRNFMIVFGLHSSMFDFITFYVLYFYFRLSQSAFRTGWFLESAITELLILFIVRTKKPFIKSKPGRLLIITATIAFVTAVYLPFSPFANLLGFSIAHSQQIVALQLFLLLTW